MEQQGCGYSLRIKTEDIIPVVELLRENGVPLRQNLCPAPGRKSGGADGMIYLDNGATSFRKPPGVYRAVERAMYTCANPGLGRVSRSNGSVGDGVCLPGSRRGAVSLPAGAGRADHQLHPWTEHCHPLHREAGGTGGCVRVRAQRRDPPPSCAGGGYPGGGAAAV